MTTPKNRQGVTPTIAPCVYYTQSGRYFVRVTFNPAGDFFERIDWADDFAAALDLRDTLRRELIAAVSPVELTDATGHWLGYVYKNRIVRPRTVHPRVLPPAGLFEDEEE